MRPRLLLIEDDDRIRETARLVLEDEGFVVDEAASAEEGLRRFDERAADCVLVDLMLPGKDGFECCRALRRVSDVPILVLTARADPIDAVAGLEAGADDYVRKPFHGKELAARVRALLRRAVHDPSMAGIVVLGDLEISAAEGIVRKGGEEIHLTKTEFQLLCQLAARPGMVFSREMLLEHLWGYSYVGETKLVDTHVHRLRAKIENDPAEPTRILTVRGLGYKVVR